MWIFLPDGLIMPAIAPMHLAPKSLTLGVRQIQVRARVSDHLSTFLAKYSQPELHSAIQHTPSMDYEYRAYMTHQDFAAAIAKASLDINYAKFKPEATERTYHTALNHIWGVIYNYLSAPSGKYI